MLGAAALGVPRGMHDHHLYGGRLVLHPLSAQARGTLGHPREFFGSDAYSKTSSLVRRAVPGSASQEVTSHRQHVFPIARTGLLSRGKSQKHGVVPFGGY